MRFPAIFFNGSELAPATWYATWDRPGASRLGEKILNFRQIGRFPVDPIG